MDGAVVDRLEALGALRRAYEALGRGDKAGGPLGEPDEERERSRPRMGNDTPLRPAH